MPMSARTRLFLSSYVPLFAIAALRFDGTWLRLGMLAAAVLGVASLISLIVASQRIERRTVQPTAVRDLGSEVAAYIATYLLPFLTVSQPRARDLIAYGLVMATIGVVYVQSDLLGVNPLLYLLRYRIYALEGARRTRDGADADAVIMSRRRPIANQPIVVHELSEGVYLAATSKSITTDHRP
jgi:hypothetical protein